MGSLGLLTVEQCAEYLQCSVSLVEKLIKNGELRRVALTSREVGPSQPGRKNWRISPKALEDFIQARDKTEQPRTATATAQASRPVLPLATGTDGKSRLKMPKRQS